MAQQARDQLDCKQPARLVLANTVYSCVLLAALVALMARFLQLHGRMERPVELASKPHCLLCLVFISDVLFVANAIAFEYQVLHNRRRAAVTLKWLFQVLLAVTCCLLQSLMLLRLRITFRGSVLSLPPRRLYLHIALLCAAVLSVMLSKAVTDYHPFQLAARRTLTVAWRIINALLLSTAFVLVTAEFASRFLKLIAMRSMRASSRAQEEEDGDAVQRRETISAYDMNDQDLLRLANKQAVLAVSVCVAALLYVLGSLPGSLQAHYCLTTLSVIGWSLANSALSSSFLWLYLSFPQCHPDYQRICSTFDASLLRGTLDLTARKKRTMSVQAQTSN